MRLMVKHASGRVEGDLIIPNSKYHAHRALMLASLAPGVSRIEGLSDAGHVRHTIEVLRGLGTEITTDGQTVPRPRRAFRPGRPEVSVGSSGTTLYFMIGLACLADAPVTITGQKYFQRRPVGPLLEALEATRRRARVGQRLPADPRSSPQPPAGGQVSHRRARSSQWISGLLLLAPFATGPTVDRGRGRAQRAPYVELTVG